MAFTKIWLWQKAPFLRLLVPFVVGIIIQWYHPVSLLWLLAGASTFVLFILLFSFFPVEKRFALTYVQGAVINLLLAAFGALLVWAHDVRHKAEWFGHHYKENDGLVLTIQEPLVEKTASYKALADVRMLVKNGTMLPATGNIVLYFKKDAVNKSLGYGIQLFIKKPLQVITNSGNPGSFDYKRYSLFNGVTHQCYLTQQDYIILPQRDVSLYKKALFSSRSAIINILQTYIKGSKEQGLAEALLIGYKDDLDKKLVESYSNTGVVHVIAISGLHLGIIYWLLLSITISLKRSRATWLRFAIIVAGLWAFSLLAGAQPSVLRSAVMFSALALSTVINRQSSIYNTLALSAFALLCYNPFWLWDVGFQLSYAAVLSIILFFKPVYDWIYFPNKMLDFLWKLMAVSLAAQILTLPISIYHFHQFPFLFLFANLLAVPLSSIILIGEIILCIVSPVEALARVTGSVLYYLLGLMNGYVERLDMVSFAVWDALSISVFQTALLYAIIAAGALWLMEKQRAGLTVMLTCLIMFIALRSLSFIKAANQQKIIVYNVPKHTAIDVIEGRKYHFIGDEALQKDDFLRNFHIQPSRIVHRVKEEKELAPNKSFLFLNKQVLIIDTTIQFNPAAHKTVIDVLILSKNPQLYLDKLAQQVTVKQVVVDGSVPLWKARLWKKDCDSMQIPFYNVAAEGAFVMER